MATSVSVEAEFYYRVISHDLGRDTAMGEKSHIYIFEKPEDWAVSPEKGGRSSRGREASTPAATSSSSAQPGV